MSILDPGADQADIQAAIDAANAAATDGSRIFHGSGTYGGVVQLPIGDIEIAATPLLIKPGVWLRGERLGTRLFTTNGMPVALFESVNGHGFYTNGKVSDMIVDVGGTDFDVQPKCAIGLSETCIAHETQGIEIDNIGFRWGSDDPSTTGLGCYAMDMHNLRHKSGGSVGQVMGGGEISYTNYRHNVTNIQMVYAGRKADAMYIGTARQKSSFSGWVCAFNGIVDQSAQDGLIQLVGVQNLLRIDNMGIEGSFARWLYYFVDGAIGGSRVDMTNQWNELNDDNAGRNRELFASNYRIDTDIAGLFAYNVELHDSAILQYRERGNWRIKNFSSQVRKM
jgi:hypothetical protein